jgi:AcrR family transcriptional regulator
MRHHDRIGLMPRWEPQARDRLRDAALELFLEHGYDNVTVAQITERAGLTRRTFSRYFTDKRDVLFADSDELPAALATAVERADPDLAPFPALLAALAEVGDLIVDDHATERRAIVAASPELQERGLTKFAAVTSALAAALEQRGADAATAALIAPVGVAIFRAALDRWARQPERTSVADRIHETAAELAANMQPVETTQFLTTRGGSLLHVDCSTSDRLGHAVADVCSAGQVLDLGSHDRARFVEIHEQLRHPAE